MERLANFCAVADAGSIAKKMPKSVGDALATVPLALPIGGWMREKTE